jgi:DNA adenine methylase
MKPFIKWAGGKGQLLVAIQTRLPRKYINYYEPFIGSGALLFELKPNKAIINDINKELIHTYTIIRDQLDQLISKLNEIDFNHQYPHKEYYYTMRNLYNSKILDQTYDVDMAALFIYLNKHCFNGLYRVNSNGLFNVPFNQNLKGNSFNEDNLIQVSEFLKNVKILNSDFEEAVKDAKKGDFVFFDSPYAPLKDDSFESYTREGFSYEEHIRLANLFKKLSDQGVYCMLTNHNTSLIRELYKDYIIDVVPVKRFINSDAKNRVGEEVIVTNYRY